jgi:hypothetical protein
VRGFLFEAPMASLLPNGKQQFIDILGRPLVGGQVFFYAPGTETKKDTYQDQAQTTPNTNPVVLDARGQATIWGTGSYRQVVKDRFGITVWDQVISDLSDLVGVAADTLRADLSSTSDAAKGDALIGVKASFAGGAARTQDSKNADYISASDFGAVGDGVIDDTAKFTAFEVGTTGKPVDLLGKTYVVSAIPANNRYFNGNFLVGTTTTEAPYSGDLRAGNGIVTIGRGNGNALPRSYQMPANQFGYSMGLVSIGSNNLKNLTSGSQTVAIGANALEKAALSFDNIAIGEVALQEVQSASDAYSTSLTKGTRNVGIGGNAGQKLVDGTNNVFVGRNSGTGCVSTSGATAIGSNTLFGIVVNGWYATTENYTPNNNSIVYLTGVGQYAANLYYGVNVTAVGAMSARYLKLGQGVTAIGTNAALQLEMNSGFNGNVKTTVDNSVHYNYTKTGSNLVVTMPGHSGVAGGYVGIHTSDGVAAMPHGHYVPLQITAADANTFTISCPYTTDGTGTCTISYFTSLVAAPTASNMTIIGNAALQTLNDGNNNVVVGAAAMNATTTASSAVAIGKDTMRYVLDATTSVAVGTSALRDNPQANSCTAVGHNAGLLKQDGTTPTGQLANSTMVGANSRVSGDNQVQLGDSATTTYVYGTVQNRSDLRDKVDVRNTVLGLDFVNALRPVDYKWDMREDYVELYDEQVGVDDTGAPIIQTKARALPKDGSKVRKRYHHGLIAQEVEALIAKTGVDFGGFQNHAVDGGSDVLTIGYDELIGPLIKAVQELSAKVAAQSDIIDGLVERLASIESRA